MNLPFGGWSWSDPKWEIDGAVNGSYYAENTAIGINDISGTASFVADGYIEVSGSPTNLSPDLTVGTVTYSMVAGYDLKLNGNAATTIEGVFFANHQVDISGNPNINGQVIAADVADVGFPPDGNNLISLSSGWDGIQRQSHDHIQRRRRLRRHDHLRLERDPELTHHCSVGVDQSLLIGTTGASQ